MERRGIATAGCWIVDRIKQVSHWPEQDTLAWIADEERAGGGGAYNCAVDLASLGVPYPLWGVGCLGDDTNGAWLRRQVRQHQIDDRWLRTGGQAATSYTDVMSVAASGRRTFFHHVGANALFGPADVPVAALEARVVHLAYLLLLPALDAADAEYGSVGARVLAGLSAAGLVTSLDVVSEDSPRVRQVVWPALAHVDCLVINEYEAHALTGVPTRHLDGSASLAGLRTAAAALLAGGVRRLVVIHLPEAGFAATRDGDEHIEPSRQLPAGYIQGAVGAGDAFAAGVLHGLHEGWPPDRMLALASATATACLRHPTSTGGIGPLDETLALRERFPAQAPPV